MASITKGGWKICKPCDGCEDFNMLVEEYDISMAMQSSRERCGARIYFKNLKCGCYYEENKYGDVHSGYRCPYKN